MDIEKIMVIAAHPDDDVLGCGGTLCKYAKLGTSIRVVFLGEGSTCRFPGNALNSAEARAAITNRQESAINALETLDISSYVFHETACGRFDQTPLIELGQLIEAEIHGFKPDAVFTHAANDINNDHKLSHQATLQATRPGAQNFVPWVLSYEVLSSTEWRFTDSFLPNLFIDIDAEIETKIDAFLCYDSEAGEYPFPRSREGILTLSKRRGMQAGLKYAEAFHLIRGIQR